VALSAAFSAALDQLVQITTLELGIAGGSSRWLGGGVLATLSNMLQLEQLSLNDIGTRAQPVQLSDLPSSLTALSVFACNTSGEGLDSLTSSSSSSSSSRNWQPPQLRQLCISGSSFRSRHKGNNDHSGAALLHPALLQPMLLQLQHLEIWTGESNVTGGRRYERVTWQSVAAVLPQLQQLRHLILAYFDITAAAAEDFAALTSSGHLTALELRIPQLPAAAVLHMFPAGRLLPQLKSVRVVDSVNAVYRQRHEEYYTWGAAAFVGCLQLGRDDAAQRLAACCPQLEDLGMVMAGADVAAADLLPLVQLTALTRLSVFGAGWTDEAAEHVLAKLTGGLHGNTTRREFAKRNCLLNYSQGTAYPDAV
jgi:hypothetical protein